MTKYIFVSFWKAYLSLMTNGCSLSFRMFLSTVFQKKSQCHSNFSFIYLHIILSIWFFLITSSFLMIFIAKIRSVSFCLTSITLPKEPLPNTLNELMDDFVVVFSLLSLLWSLLNRLRGPLVEAWEEEPILPVSCFLLVQGFQSCRGSGRICWGRKKKRKNLRKNICKMICCPFFRWNWFWFNEFLRFNFNLFI